MITRIVGLLLVLAFAGCLKAVPTAEVQGSEQELLFQTWPIDVTRLGREPSIAISPDGAIFVCSIRGMSRGTDLWVSRDGGSQFSYIGRESSDLTPPVRSGGGDIGGGDCDVSVDAGGRVYVVDTWLGSVSVASSTDYGATWRGVPVSTAAPDADRPWVLGGEVEEVFLTMGQQAGEFLPSQASQPREMTGIWVARSLDGGLTFPQQVLAAGNERRIGLNGNLGRDGDNLYLVYTEGLDEGILVLKVALSRDRGITWTEREIARQAYDATACSPLHVFPIIAADAAGSVYAVWVLPSSETNRLDLYFAASLNAGETWSQPQLITDRLGTRAIPWVVTGDPGRVGLVWYETNMTGHDRKSTGNPASPYVEICEYEGIEEGAEWYLHYAFSLDARLTRPAFQETRVQSQPIHTGPLGRPYEEVLQVRFDPQGRAVIAYVADRPEGVARPMFAIQSAGARGLAEPAS